MTFIRYRGGDSSLSRRERLVLSGSLWVVGVLTAFDVFEDWRDGAPLSHIIPEVLVICLAMGAAVYLLRYAFKKRKTEIEATKREVALAKTSAQNWQSKAESLSKGITDAISAQFDEWSLSPAEQEVSFLLLKGLSIQEIAEIRETSERTVRQQASEVYKKSGLSGRAQLSAFFMEDLFS